MRQPATPRRTARGNRAGLALVGVLLLAAGAAAVVRGLGVVPDVLGAPDQPWWDPALRDAAAQAWFWPVVAVGLVLVALVALRWLAVQTRSGALRSVRLEADPGHGHTVLPARVVAAALRDDLADNPRLRRSQVVLTGRPHRPHLHLSLTVPAEADPVEVRYGVRRALHRHRRALELEDLPTTVVLR